MTAVATRRPSPTPSTRRRPPRLELPSILFFGRSLEEYERALALDLAALRRRPVLDVAAGPSSFTAEACRLGIDAVAVDPRYGPERPALAVQVDQDYARMEEALRCQPQLLRPGFAGAATKGRFASLPAALSERRAAARRFLEDYDTPQAQGRYFAAALPLLPFLDGSFDVVLCADFLFLYESQLDDGFHLAACRELLRVSRHEVRVHPLCGPHGRRSPRLAPLLEHLRRDGYNARIVPVSPRFFRGATETLILTRNAAPSGAASRTGSVGHCRGGGGR